MSSLDDRASVWTLVWTLPMIDCGVCAEVPGILWVRHDRGDPECVSVFLNDAHLWSRKGPPSKPWVLCGSAPTFSQSSLTGSVETIQFQAAGRSAQLFIAAAPSKLGSSTGLGRIVAGSDVRYTLKIDGVGDSLLPDMEGNGRLPAVDSAALWPSRSVFQSGTRKRRRW